MVMKAPLLAVLAAGLPALAAAQAQPGPQPGALTPERVFSSPGLSGPAARGVEVSPDGRTVTYLKAEPDNQNKFDLWAAPVAGGKARLLVSGQTVEPAGQQLTEVEKNRRERQRVAALTGVVDYTWD